MRALKIWSHPTVYRWSDILCLGFICGVAYAYFAGRFGAFVVLETGNLFGPGQQILRYASCLGVSILLIGIVHRLARIELQHARHVLQYPPFAVAVVAGLLVASVLPRILPGFWVRSLTLTEALAAAIFYLLIWFAHTLLNYFTEPRPPATVTRNPGLKAHGKLSDVDLQVWLEREVSVSDRSLDLFGHAEIADRLVDRLTVGESTIALQGEFGSGKSSICRMADAEAKHRRAGLLFVYASCWGFEDPAGAQKHVLEAILSAVGREVDCLAIRQLPYDYLQTVASDIGWLRSLLRLCRSEQSPVEQLQRLSPILAAIDRRVVLVIEDVDRTGQDFDIGRIQSLLMQFRAVSGISFILAISPLQQVDFAKLCEHLEVIPPLERCQILELIDQVRELALREHPPGIVLSKLESLAMEDRDYRMLNQHLEYFWPWQLSLCGVLNRPRLLKHALRRVLGAWPHLQGEVHFDHLISVAALRTGAPGAFAFLCERFPLFAPAFKPPDPHLREEARVPLKAELRKEWRKLCATGQFDARAVGGLFRDIYPLTSVVTELSAVHTVIPQSTQAKTRSEVYARRLFTERTERNEISDQKLLGLMQAAATNQEARVALAEAITASRFASVAFEHFAGVQEFKPHLALLTEVYACIRRTSSPDADTDGFPGFFAPWRLISLNRPEGYEEWLVGELRLCVRTHLRLLTSIYYYWLGTDRHTRAERERPREVIVNALRSAWTEMRPEDIAASFAPTYPYVLFHLMFTTDFQTPEQVPLGAVAHWKWSGPILLRVSRACPELILPQILVALNDDSKRDGPAIRFELDRAKLDGWFGADGRQILQLAAAGFEPPLGMTEQFKYLIKLAIEGARAEVARRAPPTNGNGMSSP